LYCGGGNGTNVAVGVEPRNQLLYSAVIFELLLLLT